MTPDQELMIRRLRAMGLNTCNEAADLIESMAQQGAVAATLIVRQESDTPKVTGWNEVVFPVGEEVALYLAPQLQRVPLSDEQIWSLWEFPADLSWKESVIKLGHAIEQAHGIRSEK